MKVKRGGNIRRVVGLLRVGGESLLVLENSDDTGVVALGGGGGGGQRLVGLEGDQAWRRRKVRN